MAAETHRYGKMEWVFYIIILPLLFTALLSGVILQFMGFDITGSIAQKFKALTGNQQATMSVKTASSSDPAKLLKDSQDKLKTLQKTNQQLQDDLTSKNSQIDSMQKQIDSLKGQGSNSNGNTGTPGGDTSTNNSAPAADPIQTQADIYSQMSATNAAAILKNVPVSQAKKILSKMSADDQASILQKMDPVIASQILSQP